MKPTNVLRSLISTFKYVCIRPSLGENPKGISQDLNVTKGAFTNYVDTGVHLLLILKIVNG